MRVLMFFTFLLSVPHPASVCRHAIHPACQKHVTSPHHSFKPDSNVTNQLFPVSSFHTQQTNTDSQTCQRAWPLPLIHSHSHHFVLFFHTSTHAYKRTTHTHTHTGMDTQAWIHTHTHTHRQQAGDPSFHFSTTVQRSTTSRSTSRNLDKHIYSWFLCREGQTVIAGWQARHISLSGKILHAFVWLYNSYCGSTHEHQGCRRQPVSLWNEVKMPLRACQRTCDIFMYLQV